MRLLSPERPLDYVGPRAILDSIFAISFVFILLLLAWGLGKKSLDKLNISALSELNIILFSLAIGLGLLAYGVLALGLLGILTSQAIFLFLVASALITRTELAKISRTLPSWPSHFRHQYSKINAAEKSLLVLALLILGFATLQALAPPWGYDALMYHLQAPRLWLEAGKITLLPDIWQPNGPMTIEMLFTIGLAVESDVTARLIHLTFAVLVYILCFNFGKDLLGRTGGVISVAILLGIPILPLWSSLAYADMSLALFTLLAIYALYLWRLKKQNTFLLLAGLMMGWALGSKYTALGSFAIVGLWLLLHKRKDGLAAITRTAAFFVLPSLVIAAPWYLKNFFLSGNPLYPFVFCGPGWDEARLTAVMDFLVNGFGMGRTILDYITLPFHLYSNTGSFSTVFGTIDYPSFLFPLLLLYPFTRPKETINLLFGFVAFFFVFWALGTQQTRFLIPIYPLLSVLTASVLLWLGAFLPQKSLNRILVNGLVGGLVVLTIAYQVLSIVDNSPYSVVLGKESKQSFLTRVVFDFPAIRFANENLDENRKILMLWNGQGYYCDQRCIADPDQTRLHLLTVSKPSPKQLANELISDGISHILVDAKGLRYFYLHDPNDRHQQAANYFYEYFAPMCAKRIFADDAIQLYEISCVNK